MSPPNLEDLQNLSPNAFEQLVKKVFDGLGYEATVTGRSGDGGVDLVLEKGDERSIVQAKRYKGQVGQSVLREFYGTVVHEKAQRGYLVTTGAFSLPAQAWAQGKNLVLVDGADLGEGMSTLGMEVEAAPSSPTAPAELSRLGEALRNARDHKAYLRVAFLGAPLDLDGYERLGDAVKDVLQAKRHVILRGNATREETADGLLAFARDDLVVVDGLGEDLGGASLFIEVAHQPDTAVRPIWAETSHTTRIREVHLLCTVWEPKKLDRLPLRERMKFKEAFPLQIGAESIDWLDVDGWVRAVAEQSNQPD